jgi:hypothetical protein
MALIHQATLTPTKIELLSAWLPSRRWAHGAAEVSSLGAYRFDDPAGAVGIETFLLAAGDGTVLHVPLTYRAEPVAGLADHLVGTTAHSVLGTRWIYDGCADPVWAAALATTVLTGGTQVEEFVDQGDGRLVRRDNTATVIGSGTGSSVAPVDVLTTQDEEQTTLVRAGGLELVVVRVVGAEVVAAQTLTGSWTGGGPAVLAGVNPL